MSEERFAWARVDNVTGAFELKKRNVRRTLTKDSNLQCWVRGCGKRCKRGEECYYPASGLSASNKIIGHVECVDRVCAEHTAKSAAEARTFSASAKNLLTLPSRMKTQALPSSLGQKVQEEFERLCADMYAAGREAGRAEMRAELSALLQEDARHA